MRRRRSPTAEKIRLIEETMQPGDHEQIYGRNLRNYTCRFRKIRFARNDGIVCQGSDTRQPTGAQGAGIEEKNF